MTRLKILSALAFLFLIIVSCGEQEGKEKNDDYEKPAYGESKVEVYYFYGARRCANCNAIEDVSKALVQDKYKDNDDVKFFSIDFEKPENSDIAKKYDITWSSLVIVSEDRFIDLTIEAFQYSMSNPEVLRQEMVGVIEDFL